MQDNNTKNKYRIIAIVASIIFVIGVSSFFILQTINDNNAAQAAKAEATKIQVEKDKKVEAQINSIKNDIHGTTDRAEKTFKDRESISNSDSSSTPD